MKIQPSKDLGASDAVQQLWNQRQWVAVLNRDFVQSSEVHHRSQRTVLLWYENNGTLLVSSVRGPITDKFSTSVSLLPVPIRSCGRKVSLAVICRSKLSERPLLGRDIPSSIFLSTQSIPGLCRCNQSYPSMMLVCFSGMTMNSTVIRVCSISSSRSMTCVVRIIVPSASSTWI